MKLKRFAILTVLAATLGVAAAEFRPVAVTTATETYGARYAAGTRAKGRTRRPIRRSPPRP